MPLHFTYIIRSQLCFLFCCILRLADLPQLFQSTHSRKYISCFRFITSTCLQKIISPDQLNSEVLVTPPFCFYWICLTIDCKDIYISTTSLNDRIFKAINLSSVQNKALITFIDVGQKVPLWLFFSEECWFCTPLRLFCYTSAFFKCKSKKSYLSLQTIHPGKHIPNW